MITNNNPKYAYVRKFQRNWELKFDKTLNLQKWASLHKSLKQEIKAYLKESPKHEFKLKKMLKNQKK